MPGPRRKSAYREARRSTVVRIPRGKQWRNKTFFFANIIPLFHNYWRLALKAFIKSYHIDVIHAHDLYMARSACEAARQQDIPWVLDLHENFPEAVKGYRWAGNSQRWVTRPGAGKVRREIPFESRQGGAAE
ncbi:MAG: glycosyltransferase [Bacteroidales bacterium]|nr:glycosyltransferase [Bacteroidales bacterium]